MQCVTDVVSCVHGVQGDFVVIHGDLVTEASLHDVADMHRTNDATVTMLLKVWLVCLAERRVLRGHCVCVFVCVSLCCVCVHVVCMRWRS